MAEKPQAAKSPGRPKRPTIQPLGAEYQILLAIWAWQANKSEGEQIRSIVQARLMARKSEIIQGVKDTANMAGLDPDGLWNQILAGTAPTPDEIRELIAKRASGGDAASPFVPPSE